MYKFNYFININRMYILTILKAHLFKAKTKISLGFGSSIKQNYISVSNPRKKPSFFFYASGQRIEKTLLTFGICLPCNKTLLQNDKNTTTNQNSVNLKESNPRNKGISRFWAEYQNIIICTIVLLLLSILNAATIRDTLFWIRAHVRKAFQKFYFYFKPFFEDEIDPEIESFLTALEPKYRYVILSFITVICLVTIYKLPKWLRKRLRPKLSREELERRLREEDKKRRERWGNYKRPEGTDGKTEPWFIKLVSPKIRVRNWDEILGLLKKYWWDEMWDEIGAFMKKVKKSWVKLKRLAEVSGVDQTVNK